MSETLSRGTVVAEAEESKDLCFDAVYHSGWLYEELLDRWTVRVLALKSISDPYPDEQLDLLLERCDQIEHMDDPSIDDMVEHAVRMAMVERLLIPIGRIR